MIAPCGCHPGTFENGWHETRSQKCRQREIEQFARTIHLAASWMTENRERLIREDKK